MARNPWRLWSRSPMEWGRKARKEEDKLRGFRSRADSDEIRLGLSEFHEDPPAST